MDLNNRRTGKHATKPRPLGLLGHSGSWNTKRDILLRCNPPRWRRGSGLDWGSEDPGSIPGLPSPRVGPLMARKLKTSLDLYVLYFLDTVIYAVYENKVLSLTSQCPCRVRLGTLNTASCPWRWVPGSRSKIWKTGQLSCHYIAEITLNETLNHNIPTNQLRCIHSFKSDLIYDIGHMRILDI